METAGRTLDDKDLSEAMKENGLGTPATRAEIIETLLRRGLMERRGKALAASDKGIHLIAVVDPEVKTPALTGQWEAQLACIQRGKGDLGTFLNGIEAFVRRVVGTTLGGAAPAAASRPAAPTAASHPAAPAQGLSKQRPTLPFTGRVAPAPRRVEPDRPQRRVEPDRPQRRRFDPPAPMLPFGAPVRVARRAGAELRARARGSLRRLRSS